MLRRSYKRRLTNDEVLVKCLHQHWRVIARPVLFTTAIVIPPLAILVTIFDEGWGGVLFALVAIVALGLWCRFALPKLVSWYSLSYAVTSRRVLFRKGVLTKRYQQVELLGVNNPELERSGLDLIFGTGTINLGNQTMTLIPHVLEIETLISQLASNQTKDVREITHLLRALGYSRLTMK